MLNRYNKKNEPQNTSRTYTTTQSKTTTTTVNPNDRQRMVRETAYYLAQKRGFAPGHDVEDWVTAERTVDQQLRKRGN